MQLSVTRTKGVFTFRRFQIPYRVFGSGEDIICLNGAQQSMAMWFSFLQRFANRSRITLFDFPHQGKAKINYGASYVSLDEQVDILHALVKELDIKSASLCTASWGGVVALLFALRFPQYTKRLLMASIGMRPNALMKDIILAGIAMNKNNRTDMADLLIRSFGENLPQVVKDQIVAQFEAMTEERIRAFSEHGMSVILNEAIDNLIPLSKINKPTFILYGENDKIIDFEDVKSISAQIPDCSIEVIPRVGHFLHLENEGVFEVYERVIFTEAITAANKIRKPAVIS
jgi:pimeloyl-ACP methyl ester carboxylesterase